MNAIELLEKLPHGLNREEQENCGYSAHRLRRIRWACVRWESWRRNQGGMWVALNRGQAGAARGLRLLRYMEKRNELQEPRHDTRES